MRQLMLLKRTFGLLMIAALTNFSVMAQDQPPPPNSDPNYQDAPYDQNTQGPDQQQASNITYDQFNNTLSPYGHWENTPEYGMVWICNEPDFRPYYSNGYWNYAGGSWIWVSNYAWGWAPFHYGRWKFKIGFGWFWVPGYEWAPAWVCWRHNGEHYGWAPLEPGITFSMAFGGTWNCPMDYWTFVPHRYLTERHFEHYAVNRTENGTYFHNTTYIKNLKRYNGAKISRGPSRTEVQAHTNRPVQKMQVHEVSKPQPYSVSHNAVHVYRPQVTPQNHYQPNGGGYHGGGNTNNGGHGGGHNNTGGGARHR